MTASRDGRASTVRLSCNNPRRCGLLVSLHDVTPAHAGRLARAERFLERLGIAAVTYLFVPNFHGRFPAHADRHFIDWCRAPRSYAVEWFLHGYVHREDASAPGLDRRSTVADGLRRRLLTAGEGEFLALRGTALEARVEAGIDSFVQAIGQRPTGFVAPAWLYNEQLFPALDRVQVRYTESHFHLFDVRCGCATPAPVMTWASRSGVHRAGSVAFAAFERRWWRDRPLVRVALHPGDFDHPSIVESISRSLDTLRATRRIVTVAEAAAAAPSQDRASRC